MKRVIIFLFFLQNFILQADQELTVFIDENKFLNAKGNTELEITYSLPYYSLDFIHRDLGYEAEIFVDISVKKDGKLISNESFTNKVIIRDAVKVFSDEVYLDKITITLPSYEFSIEVDFTDIHLERSYGWSYHFEPLEDDSIFSELELSSDVIADSTSYLAKFHRDGTLYKVQPDHSFIRDKEFIYFYHELYNLTDDTETGEYKILREFEIRQEDILVDRGSEEISGKWKPEISLTRSIAVNNLQEGYYTLIVTIEDLLSSKKESREDYFFLKEYKSQLPRFFSEIEDDFKLAGYFFNNNQIRIWKTLSQDGKKKFLEKFWLSKDPNPATEENEFLNILEERINYANINYTRFNPGWSSDMGRIHIKYGFPYEISKHNTNLGDNQFSEYSEYDLQENLDAFFYNKYVIRNYQIWKYRLKNNVNYIFVDIMTNGDYKLIYSSDDNDGEPGVEDWRKYLGYDFDDRLLD